MNFLAHTFFAQMTPHSMVGNLLGDFCRGVDVKALSPQIYAGLANHRAIDKFTDQHPQVRESKMMFSASKKRFSSIALDVVFDYYLIKHWHRYSDQNFLEYKAQVYGLLEKGNELMPRAMAQTMARVVSQDWFASYQTLDGIGFALDRIAMRVRFDNHFSGVLQDIIANEAAIESAFLTFFPQLQDFVKMQSIEINV